MKLILESGTNGAWPPATSGTANTSGANNPLVAAASVGAGKVLQVAFVKVRNTSSTGTTVKVTDSDGAEVFADYVDAGEAFVFNAPFELAEGKGLSLNLSGANAHHWSVLTRTRDV